MIDTQRDRTSSTPGESITRSGKEQGGDLASARDARQMPIRWFQQPWHSIVSTIIVGTRPGPDGRPQGEALQQDLCVDERRYDEDTLLRLAASVEQLSTHILARAIIEAAQEDELPLSPATDFAEVFGKGVQGNVPLLASDQWPFDADDEAGQVAVAVGNRTFMKQLGITIPSSLLAAREHCVALGQIGSFIAVDGRIAGLIVWLHPVRRWSRSTRRY